LRILRASSRASTKIFWLVESNMSDKLVGIALFLFSLVVFVYYSVWVLLTVRAGPRIRGT